ncbi:acyl-homoserine-lactone synthase [Defluviimonas sp. CAU 1641]|uniref:Acyl-homoserine-lactone synthase n=2 Tax=Defluviimonas salinarum TaxID=2992147 RepID=A0ABT3JAS8_9RHOB|nr:acyl-homoserine-lactone synthase [Defluviimonas salinarum]
MLHIVNGYERSQPEYKGLIDQMHQLRARSFHDRRGWRVTVQDGREIDAFDDLDPLYVLVSDGAGRLAASLRLLPTTGPYMMSEVFPEVLGPQGVIRHPQIWESSRFCVDTEVARDFGTDSVNRVTRMLLAGMFRTAFEAGMINIVSVYDVYVERILKRAGCTFERLGPVVTYDKGLRTTSGLFEVSAESVARLEVALEEKARVLA